MDASGYPLFDWLTGPLPAEATDALQAHASLPTSADDTSHLLHHRISFRTVSAATTTVIDHTVRPIVRAVVDALAQAPETQSPSLTDYTTGPPVSLCELRHRLSQRPTTDGGGTTTRSQTPPTSSSPPSDTHRNDHPTEPATITDLNGVSYTSCTPLVSTPQRPTVTERIYYGNTEDCSETQQATTSDTAPAAGDGGGDPTGTPTHQESPATSFPANYYPIEPPAPTPRIQLPQRTPPAFDALTTVRGPIRLADTSRVQLDAQQTAPTEETPICAVSPESPSYPLPVVELSQLTLPPDTAVADTHPLSHTDSTATTAPHSSTAASTDWLQLTATIPAPESHTESATPATPAQQQSSSPKTSPTCLAKPVLISPAQNRLIKLPVHIHQPSGLIPLEDAPLQQVTLGD